MFVFHRKGEECRTQKWRWQRRRPEKEESEAAEDSFHQPAAARARSHLSEESLPGHEHKRGDSRVDQPHRGQSQGKSRDAVRKTRVKSIQRETIKMWMNGFYSENFSVETCSGFITLLQAYTRISLGWFRRNNYQWLLTVWRGTDTIILLPQAF